MSGRGGLHPLLQPVEGRQVLREGEEQHNQHSSLISPGREVGVAGSSKQLLTPLLLYYFQSCQILTPVLANYGLEPMKGLLGFLIWPAEFKEMTLIVSQP